MAAVVIFSSAYYHADGLGSIVAMTDDQARNVQQYEYDSFGNQHDMKNRIKQPYGYTGREHDRETGLRYYRARYYDGEVGVFLSKDPISFLGGDVNLYRYVENRPTQFIDPRGLETVTWSVGYAAAAYGVGNASLSTGSVLYESNKGFLPGDAYQTASLSGPTWTDESGNEISTTYALGASGGVELTYFTGDYSQLMGKSHNITSSFLRWGDVTVFYTPDGEVGVTLGLSLGSLLGVFYNESDTFDITETIRNLISGDCP